MRGVLFCILVLVLGGCISGKRSLLDYRCGEKVLDAVERQFKICVKSSYSTSLCYLSAVHSHCLEFNKFGRSMPKPTN